MASWAEIRLINQRRQLRNERPRDPRPSNKGKLSDGTKDESKVADDIEGIERAEGTHAEAVLGSRRVPHRRDRR